MEKPLSDPKCICAMKEELESIQKNNNWDLVDLPEEKKQICVIWVLKVKENPKGEIINHKARLIAKGFLQREGMYFEEVFTLVDRIDGRHPTKGQTVTLLMPVSTFDYFLRFLSNNT